MFKKFVIGNKVVQQMGYLLIGMLVIKKFFKRFFKREWIFFIVIVLFKEYELIYWMVFKWKFNLQYVYEVIKKFVDDKLDKMIYSKKWLLNLIKILCN